MSKTNHRKTAFAATLGGAALLATGAVAAGSLFQSTDLGNGYALDDAQITLAEAEGKCGEGKCGEGEAGAKADGGEGKCGEGKCGEGEAGAKADGGEGKCGEGKCGEGDHEGGEGKCGEGKCGE